MFTGRGPGFWVLGAFRVQGLGVLGLGFGAVWGLEPRLWGCLLVWGLVVLGCRVFGMRSGFRFWGCLGFGGLGCICRLGFGYVGL